MINIGHRFVKSTGYHDGKLHENNGGRNHYWEVIEIYPNKISFMKDILLCKELNLGYKECFFRMDVKEGENENRNTNEIA